MASYNRARGRGVGNKQSRDDWDGAQHEIARRVSLSKKRKRDNGEYGASVRTFWTIEELDIDKVIFVIPEAKEVTDPDGSKRKKDLVPEIMIPIEGLKNPVPLKVELGPFVAQATYMDPPGRKTAKTKEWGNKYKMTLAPDKVHPAVQAKVPNYKERQARAIEFCHQLTEKLLAFCKEHPETFQSFRKAMREDAMALYPGKHTKEDRDQQEWDLFCKKFRTGLQKDELLSADDIAKLREEGVTDEDLLKESVVSGIKLDTNVFIKTDNAEVHEAVKARLLEDPKDEAANYIVAAAKAGYELKLPRVTIDRAKKPLEFWDTRCRNLDDVQGIAKALVYSEGKEGGWKFLLWELLVLVRREYVPTERVEMKPMVDASWFDEAPPDPFPELKDLPHDIAVFALSKHRAGEAITTEHVHKEFSSVEPTAVAAALDALVDGDNPVIEITNGINVALVNPPREAKKRKVDADDDDDHAEDD